ncbi:MAG: lipoyl(octanoyl) transferase LipB [Proteobacteria bacterium]|nr:lipoyl(octanoyl) transferase LipB [Pseudomonadota bacterium]MBU1611859.1 lipoyl(octanoyl) transferase LipB [Pseudomonadota bacterium]
MTHLEIIDLGLIPYLEAEAIQLARHAEVLAGGPEALFVLEHPRVITLGRQGGRENLHVSDDYLAEQGIELVQASRGGNITCHFPGQLVAYPVLRIDRRPGGIKRFFRDMEEAVLQTARHFGVEAGRDPERPGVWVGATMDRKICSIGIAVKRWVSYHGLSFNIGHDLSLFELITLCGLTGATPTSLCLEAGRDIDIREVKDVFRHAFQATQDSTLAAGEAAAG